MKKTAVLYFRRHNIALTSAYITIGFIIMFFHFAIYINLLNIYHGPDYSNVPDLIYVGVMMNIIFIAALMILVYMRSLFVKNIINDVEDKLNSQKKDPKKIFEEVFTNEVKFVYSFIYFLMFFLILASFMMLLFSAIMPMYDAII